MMNMRTALWVVLFLLVGWPSVAQEAYRQPSERIVQLVDAPQIPVGVLSPDGRLLALSDYTEMVTMADLAQPMLRLAGLRILPRFNCLQRTFFVHGFRVLEIATGKETRFEVPPGARFGAAGFSPNGKLLAACRYQETGSQVWVFDPSTGKGKPVSPARVNSILLPPYQWSADSASLFVPLVPDGRAPPPTRPEVPTGPVVQETKGATSKVRTYQDLLKDALDEERFAFVATAQLTRIHLITGEVQRVGEPDLIRSASLSPDGNWLLMDVIRKPFSRVVPEGYFAHRFELRRADGTLVKRLAELPVSDQLPIQGVPTGWRDPCWQPLLPATLIWVEALDGGDPEVKAPFRDRAMRMVVPAEEEPKEWFRFPFRFAGWDWLASPGLVLATDYDRDRKWITTWLLDLNRPVRASESQPLFARSVHDRYADPGNPVAETTAHGERVGILASGCIFLKGEGATPEGLRPFLRRFDLATKASETLFLSASSSFEIFVGFRDASRTAIITRRESPTDPPNFQLRPLGDHGVGESRALTAFPDPAPEFQKIRKELLTYQRADGIPLSGTLYYPLDGTPGTRVPTVVWAYPREYTSKDTAGQVRTTTNRYTSLERDSVLFFVLRGYAVLYQAELPVVGDPLTANDTYVDQITAGAQAAVDKLVEVGIADRKRIGIAGHSYGAFMVANLLAHTDLFAAGIARSGAYNRTLTPFGFQGERRTFWEAPEIYMKLSSITHAHKINEPLLLIHGEWDDNSGTYPLQSERLYAAIRGHGGTARFVLLPMESHGYQARESVLQVLAEMFDWFDQHLKALPKNR